MRKKPELLAPVGNKEMLKAAVNAKADAIYFGLKSLNMRATAKNFTLNDLKSISKEPVKKYITVNTIVYENEVKKVKKLLENVYPHVDAVILWDMSVLTLAKELGYRDIHLSTQASVSNSLAANFYKKQGISRIIFARETSLNDLKKIRKSTKVEMEAFVHGAMCVSLSGRCFLSHSLFNKSANRGDCLQPCRREYIIHEPQDKYDLVLGKDYVLSPKDLCTLPFIEKLMFLDGFKIEGRSRSPEYVKTVVEVYRKAIDSYYKNELDNNLKKQLMKKLESVYNRGFSTGFYLGIPDGNSMTKDTAGNVSKTKKVAIGKVTHFYKNINVAAIKIYSNTLKTNDNVLIIGPTTGVVEQKITSMEINNNKVNKVVKGDLVAIKLDKLVRKNDKVYKYG